MNTGTIRILAAAVLLLGLAGPARAIPPVFVSDAELAAHPVLVVAKWEKAPFARRGPDDPKVYGTRTKLVVTRVIRGEIEPGVHEVLLGHRIVWGEDGGIVISNTSTMMIGDVEDVAKPNLWFLRNEGGRLGAITYRAVQPLSLEAYFAALAGEEPEKAVPALLSTSRDPETLRRVLRYVLAGGSGWPYDDLDPKEAALRTDAADAVAALLDGPVGEVRWQAASTFARLRGKAAHPRLRELLGDADPAVRAVAAGLLARARDEALIPVLVAAVEPIREGFWAVEVLQELEGWEDLRLVPGVAAFLGHDAFVYQMGDDIGIPALAARDILLDLTGHRFPPDPAAAIAAWGEVRDLAPEERRARLAELAPWPAEPLTAGIVRRGEGFVARVVNRSDSAVTISKLPYQIGMAASSGSSGHGFGNTEGADGFLTLAPGESTEFEIDVPAFLLGGEKRRGFLLYRQVGAEWGVRAWIGKVSLRFP